MYVRIPINMQYLQLFIIARRYLEKKMVLKSYWVRDRPNAHYYILMKTRNGLRDVKNRVAAQINRFLETTFGGLHI